MPYLSHASMSQAHGSCASSESRRTAPPADAYAVFAAASEDKRLRIPAFCRDLFAYSMTSVMTRSSAPLAVVAAALFSAIMADLREQVALALIAGEVNGDLYLIPRKTAWRSERETYDDPTYHPGAANLLFADPFGTQQPNSGPLLYLPDLDVFHFTSEDPRDPRGSQTTLALWAKTWACVAGGSVAGGVEPPAEPSGSSRASRQRLSD